MADLFKLASKYEDVIKNEEALIFHYDRKVQGGSRDKLAMECYRYVMQRETERALRENKTPYEYWKEEVDDKDTGN
jgi:hypothetical protein